MKNKIRANSFVEGSFISILSIVVTKMIGLFYVIPFYKIVGVKGSALYAYAYSVYNVFLDIANAGLPGAIGKIVNEYNAKGKEREKEITYIVGLRMMIIIAIVVFLILFFGSRTISYILVGKDNISNSLNDISLVIKVISFSILVMPFLSVSRGYLQGHNILSINGISQVIEQIVRIFILLIGSYMIVKVLKLPILYAVCLSLLAATIGAIVAYLFIRKRMNRKKYFDDVSLNDIKIIGKRIIVYALPFLLINIISSLYSFVDVSLTIRTLSKLGFSAFNIDFIASAISTWSVKINMIVTSIGAGICMSLIPTVVKNNTLDKGKEINTCVIQAFKIVLFISLPMCIGISFLANPIWSIFYGNSVMGKNILLLNIYLALFANVYVILFSVLQSLNKYRMVYSLTILGLVLNGILDVPLMLFCDKIGLPVYWGTIISSIIGYCIMILMAIVYLRKECNLFYFDDYYIYLKLLFALIGMIIFLFFYKKIFYYDEVSKISCIKYIVGCSVGGSTIYFIISYFVGLLEKVFGLNYKDKIKKLILKG